MMSSSQNAEPLYGGRHPGRVTVRDIAAAKASGEKWPMLTSYDALTAGIFDEAGIPVLLVGDSAGNVVFGYDTTIPVTVDRKSTRLNSSHEIPYRMPSSA